MTDTSATMREVICVLDPDEAAARDARMIAAGAGPRHALPPIPPPVLGDGILQRGPDGARAPHVGHPTPQYRLTHQGRTALPDELTGGFDVLTDGHAPLTALGETDRAFLTGIVALYEGTAPPSGHIDAPGGCLPHPRAHGHVAAIVRPGFHLFGAATDGDGLHELIGQLREQLRQPAAPAVPVPQPLLAAAEQ